MTISSIRLKQTLSARVASTGLQSSFAVGGTLSPTLTTSDANIIYGFTLISAAVNNDVKWDLAAGTLQAITGTPTCTQTLGSGSGAAILDDNGTAIPAAATVVAIYYETDKANDGDVTITTSGANGAKAGGVFTMHGDNNVNARSALLMPRVTPTGIVVNFTWTATTDIIRVICLAKSA